MYAPLTTYYTLSMDMHSMISSALYMWWWMHPVYVCVGAPLIYVLRTLYSIYSICILMVYHPLYGDSIPLLTPYWVSLGGYLGVDCVGILPSYTRARARNTI